MKLSQLRQIIREELKSIKEFEAPDTEQGRPDGIKLALEKPIDAKPNDQKNESIKTKLIDILLKKFPNNKFRYTDIVKTIVEDIKGRQYTKNNRGMYATNLSKNMGWSNTTGYLRKPGRDKRYLEKDHDGSWFVANI